MKSIIVYTLLAAFSLGSNKVNVEIVTNGQGYHIENGNKAIIVESEYYSDVEPVAIYVIE